MTINYKKRMSINPDVFVVILKNDIQHMDYIQKFDDDKFIGAEHWQLNPPVVVSKNTYTGPQFWKALTPAERVLMVNKAKASDAAGAIFESIKLNGLDFNDADDMTIGNQMATAGIITAGRLAALVG